MEVNLPQIILWTLTKKKTEDCGDPVGLTNILGGSHSLENVKA